MIRTIIIDDEPASVNVLSLLLKKKCANDVQIVATSNSPHLGKELIEQYQPDLIFLDVEMPGLSGIDLVRSFTDPSFRVIFITAYDAYAVEAFRLNAIDYLLKPVEANDIIRVVEKIKRDLSQHSNSAHLNMQNLQKLFSQNSAIAESRIGIGMADKIVFVNVTDILYCEAHGAYTTVYLDKGNKIVASRSLGDFEAQLYTHHFFRIHHSTLINLKHIKEFLRSNGGYVLMDNNASLEVSQRKRKDFLDAINDFVI